MELGREMRLPGMCAFLAVLASCSGDPLQLVPNQSMVAVVHGVVTRAEDDQPVEGVRVRASAFRESAGGCTGVGGVEVGYADSEESGVYVIPARYLPVGEEEEICVMLDLQPDSALGLVGGRVEGGTVTFRIEYLTPPVDSLWVDVALGAST